MKKSKYRLLSYHISVDAYSYGGEKPFNIRKIRSISKGDSCNTFMMDMPNHVGTHIDCPNHFFNSGKRLSQYKFQDFVFYNPVVLDCPKKKNELVTIDDIERNQKKLKGKDILFLRTGFYRFRADLKYARENPGIDPEVALFIRKRLSNIRCIGIDTISVSPYADRKLGRRTHKIFLQGSRPVPIIEDMDLSSNLKSIKSVFVVPLFIKGVDSGPCTVVAF